MTSLLVKILVASALGQPVFSVPVTMNAAAMGVESGVGNHEILFIVVAGLIVGTAFMSTLVKTARDAYFYRCAFEEAKNELELTARCKYCKQLLEEREKSRVFRTVLEKAADLEKCAKKREHVVFTI